ncbi:MAG: hypothetical protein Ct9H300mP28_16440 [Pseudomonadota bacterium]|nr:MAG: hypothetical protein Ct9H300mP28_16440 [Pseudomonadota bacterium]
MGLVLVLMMFTSITLLVYGRRRDLGSVFRKLFESSGNCKLSL